MLLTGDKKIKVLRGEIFYLVTSLNCLSPDWLPGLLYRNHDLTYHHRLSFVLFLLIINTIHIKEDKVHLTTYVAYFI